MDPVLENIAMHLPTLGSHDPVLAGLSGGVAVFASYAALDLGARVRAAWGWARIAWIAAAGVAKGGSIWSMHFVGMLAYRLPVPVSYDPAITALSLAMAIVTTAAAFAVVGGPHALRRHRLLGGALMGVGIAAMHYIGMAALRAPGVFVWNVGL